MSYPVTNAKKLVVEQGKAEFSADYVLLDGSNTIATGQFFIQQELSVNGDKCLLTIKETRTRTVRTKEEAKLSVTTIFPLGQIMEISTDPLVKAELMFPGWTQESYTKDSHYVWMNVKRDSKVDVTRRTTGKDDEVEYTETAPRLSRQARSAAFHVRAADVQPFVDQLVYLDKNCGNKEGPKITVRPAKKA